MSAARQTKHDRVCAMQETRDDVADRMGIRIALVALCVASILTAVWFVSGPSFEKCTAVANVTDRNACYDDLRRDLSKPPAKGADVPKN